MNNRGKSFYALWIFLVAESIQIVAAAMILMITKLIKIIGIVANSGWKGLSESGGMNAILKQEVTQNMQYVISVLGIVICGIIFFFWYQWEIRGDVKNSKKILIDTKYFITLIFLGFGCQFALSGIMSIIQNYLIKLFEDYAHQINTLQEGNSVIVLLLLAVVAPITEELIFRGVILHRTNRYISFLGANLLQATLFGIYHFNIVQGIYAALLGFLLGLICKKFNTIIAPIILHMTVNISSYSMKLLPDKQYVPVIIMIVGIAIMVATLRFLKVSSVFDRSDKVVHRS